MIPADTFLLKMANFIVLSLPVYFPQFEHLEKSGLLEELVEKGLLVSHTTILKDAEKIVIKPQIHPLDLLPLGMVFCGPSRGRLASPQDQRTGHSAPNDLKRCLCLQCAVYRIGINFYRYALPRFL